MSKKEFIIDFETHILDARIRKAEEGKDADKLMSQVDEQGWMVTGNESYDETYRDIDDIIRETLVESDQDMICLQPVGWKQIFGGKQLASVERHHEAYKRHPERMLQWAYVNPLERVVALEQLEYQVKELGCVALRCFNNDPWGKETGWYWDDRDVAYPLLEKCLELGIKTIAVKGMVMAGTELRYGLPYDLDKACIDFPEINFVVFHSGFPFLKEFTEACRKNENLYLGLNYLQNFLLNRPGWFAHKFGDMLFHCGAKKLIWGTDWPTTHLPINRLVDAFRDFQFTEEMIEWWGYPEITEEDKLDIFGRNMARLLNINIEEKQKKFENDEISKMKAKAV